MRPYTHIALKLGIALYISSFLLFALGACDSSLSSEMGMAGLGAGTLLSMTGAYGLSRDSLYSFIFAVIALGLGMAGGFAGVLISFSRCYTF